MSKDDVTPVEPKTEFTFGFREEWLDYLEIVAEETEMDLDKYEHFLELSKKIAVFQPIKRYRQADYVCMSCCEVLYEPNGVKDEDGDIIEDVHEREGDCYVLLLYRYAKKSRVVTPIAWLMPEIKNKPAFSKKCLLRSFSKILDSVSNKDTKVRAVRFSLDESQWELVNELKELGYKAEYKKLDKPSVGGDGKVSYHEFLIKS